VRGGKYGWYGKGGRSEEEGGVKEKGKRGGGLCKLMVYYTERYGEATKKQRT